MWYSWSEFSSMRRSTTSDPTATFSTREPVVAASSIPTWTMISSSAPGTCTSVGAVELAAEVEGPAAAVVAVDEFELLEALAVGGAAVVAVAATVVAVVAAAVVAEPLEELSPPHAAVTPSATTGTTRRRHGVLMLGD